MREIEEYLSRGIRRVTLNISGGKKSNKEEKTESEHGLTSNEDE